MTDIAKDIMDAAERRMRIGGFSGFSFREIAADVGIKSSSVHYHFPTKDGLAAAVVRRYTHEVAEKMERELELDPDPVRIWTKAFRGTLLSPGRMCPCTVLGAATLDLPPLVTAEVKRFYQMCLEKLVAGGLSEGAAVEFYSTLTGAMVVATVLGEPAIFDRATNGFRDVRVAA